MILNYFLLPAVTTLGLWLYVEVGTRRSRFLEKECERLYREGHTP